MCTVPAGPSARGVVGGRAGDDRHPRALVPLTTPSHVPARLIDLIKRARRTKAGRRDAQRAKDLRVHQVFPRSVRRHLGDVPREHVPRVAVDHFRAGREPRRLRNEPACHIAPLLARGPPRGIIGAQLRPQLCISNRLARDPRRVREQLRERDLGPALLHLGPQRGEQFADRALEAQRPAIDQPRDHHGRHRLGARAQVPAIIERDGRIGRLLANARDALPTARPRHQRAARRSRAACARRGSARARPGTRPHRVPRGSTLDATAPGASTTPWPKARSHGAHAARPKLRVSTRRREAMRIMPSVAKGS
jgi:hypothetical protein